MGVKKRVTTNQFAKTVLTNVADTQENEHQLEMQKEDQLMTYITPKIILSIFDYTVGFT